MPTRVGKSQGRAGLCLSWGPHLTLATYRGVARIGWNHLHSVWVFPKLTAGIWSSFLLRWLWHWCLSVPALDWVGLSASFSYSASCLILSKLWVCFKSQVPLLQGRVTFIPTSYIECLWESWDNPDKKPRAQGAPVCPQGVLVTLLSVDEPPWPFSPFPLLLEFAALSIHWCESLSNLAAVRGGAEDPRLLFEYHPLFLPAIV